jgi:hypothetical protein
MARASADLQAELTALAEASAAALDRLRDGDETAVEDLLERRERLLGVLATWQRPVEPAVMEAARRAVALDAELVTTLRTRLTEVGREIERMTRTRRSLISYGATPPGSSIFVERLG